MSPNPSIILRPLMTPSSSRFYEKAMNLHPTQHLPPRQNNRHSLVNTPLAKTSQRHHSSSDNATPTTVNEVDHHITSPEVIGITSTASIDLSAGSHPAGDHPAGDHPAGDHSEGKFRRLQIAAAEVDVGSGIEAGWGWHESVVVAQQEDAVEGGEPNEEVGWDWPEDSGGGEVGKGAQDRGRGEPKEELGWDWPEDQGGEEGRVQGGKRGVEPKEEFGRDWPEDQGGEEGGSQDGEGGGSRPRIDLGKDSGGGGRGREAQQGDGTQLSDNELGTRRKGVKNSIRAEGGSRGGAVPKNVGVQAADLRARLASNGELLPNGAVQGRMACSMIRQGAGAGAAGEIVNIATWKEVPG